MSATPVIPAACVRQFVKFYRRDRSRPHAGRLVTGSHGNLPDRPRGIGVRSGACPILRHGPLSAQGLSELLAFLCSLIQQGCPGKFQVTEIGTNFHLGRICSDHPHFRTPEIKTSIRGTSLHKTTIARGLFLRRSIPPGNAVYSAAPRRCENPCSWLVMNSSNAARPSSVWRWARRMASPICPGSSTRSLHPPRSRAIFA